MNLSVAVADRPRQVNKIIGYLQVFHGILVSSVSQTVVLRSFLISVVKDDKFAVYVMLERSEASFYLNCRV